MKSFSNTDNQSVTYCLPDGTELEFAYVEMTGEEVYHKHSASELSLALSLYIQHRRESTFN